MPAAVHLFCTAAGLAPHSIKGTIVMNIMAEQVIPEW
jgi:hypothetical protein